MPKSKGFNSLEIKSQKSLSGFSFIDIIIGTALVSVIFLGIFGAFQLGTKVVWQSKAKITALAIANEQIEMVRNLPYELVGVIGSFPEGILEPAATTSSNNIEYIIEPRIDYVIDALDGIAAPEDECPNDYKKVEVKVSWSGLFQSYVSLTTDVAPKNLAQECATGGGILSVSVFDAYGLMVTSPLIEIKDPATDDVIKSASPDEGKHYFSLATSTYKIVISRSGFSTNRTYGIEEVANPEKSHLMVFENQLTESSFSIDETSAFSVDTLSPWGEDHFSDSLTDSTKISQSSNILVDGGEVNLVKTPGVYFTQGVEDNNLCSFPGVDGDCVQSFTMGSQSRQISQIQLYLRKATSTPSDIYLEIRSASTTGPVMASSALITASNLPINLEWISFTLYSPVTLNASSQYFLRLRSLPDSTDPESGAKGPIHWGYASSTPSVYDGGSGWKYVEKNNNPSDAGQALEPVDFSFKIYDDEYVSGGFLISTTITSASLLNWNELSWTDSEPLNTDLKYQIYYASGTEWYLIPDTDLAGNSTGFDISPTDLSGLEITTYSELRLKANLSTGDSAFSPTLYDWQISWITSTATPIPNVIFSLEGEKIIGTDGDENPVYKYSAVSTSDADGHIDISNLEWDSYTFSIDPASGLDLADIDPSPQPINLLPDNVTQIVKLYLDAEDSLLLTVQNIETLEPIFSASVRLYNSGLGYDNTQYANEKGQTYFIPLEVATYDLDIETPSYLATSTTVWVSGDITETLSLKQVE